MLGAIILQIVLILLNAIFACAEISVLSSRHERLEELAKDGSKKARRLLVLTENPSKFLSTIQVAITLASLLGSAYAADNFAEPLVNWLIKVGTPLQAEALESICVFLITIILSFFSIVVGELVPKRIGMKSPEKIALGLSGLLYVVSIIFKPFVWVLTKATNLLLRLFKINPNEVDDAVSEEEIRMMLRSGSLKGTIDAHENEIIQNVFEFDDISISEICTHRKYADFLNANDTLTKWKKTIGKTRHSYYPVCDENEDDIIGVLNVKKLYRSDLRDMKSVIERCVEKPYFVSENMKADTLFTTMKETRSFFAVVVDEYGGTRGVITMHDLLEVLVGELSDENDEEENEIIRLDSGKYEIVGTALLSDVERVLGVELDNDDYDTFGGYVFSLYGSIADDGTAFTVETDLLSIEAVEINDHLIKKMIVTKK